ncbi:hypothetical protein BB559_000984 [Furculomyces boomerangus]|uniref:Uncharacterized protein n=2 Tax=Harpellales TaxID=61421 RepID=A0A2T9Z3E5_9FUNG|nr:hypothetical protein BB559_004515 [Furculomyces boomerangus]PVU99115.1 hypothetical protein BB559_000984 [Furculomyces boomerangus]PWA02933.1 hypothetical protein BB558_000910 [Smittium angustum]
MQKDNNHSSTFKLEREILQKSIRKNLEDLVDGIDQTCSSLESILMLGSKLHNVSVLWEKFGTIMGPPKLSKQTSYTKTKETQLEFENSDTEIDNENPDVYRKNQEIESELGSNNVYSPNIDDKLDYSMQDEFFRVDQI